MRMRNLGEYLHRPTETKQHGPSFICQDVLLHEVVNQQASCSAGIWCVPFLLDLRQIKYFGACACCATKISLSLILSHKYIRL